MFSAIIEEALAIEKESQELIDAAKSKASQQESDLLAQTNMMIRDAQQQAKELSSQKIEQAKIDEELLAKDNSEKIALFKTTFINNYSSKIDEAAQIGFDLMISTELPLLEQ